MCAIQLGWRVLFQLVMVLLVVSCSNGNPMARMEIKKDAVIWETASNDGNVTAYLVTDFQGGATGDSIYNLVIADKVSDHGLLIFRSDTDKSPVPIKAMWTNNILHVSYGNERIWDFSNGYPAGNGTSAKTYEVVLEKQWQGL